MTERTPSTTDACAATATGAPAGEGSGDEANAVVRPDDRTSSFHSSRRSLYHDRICEVYRQLVLPGSRVLDVGCGIGGSARILARDYGFDVLGVSISPAQIRRAAELTPEGMTCRFAVMDALDLELNDGEFDAVWSVEAGPHMPDKQRYADELLRMIRPGGMLAIADWNRRDPLDGPLNRQERWVMHQLLTQWAHPEFASIRGLQHNLETSVYSKGPIAVANWNQQTLPSWNDSILEGLRRPSAVLRLGPSAIVQGLRETPTLLLMRWAFARGMMQFGVFRLDNSQDRSELG